MRVLTDYAVYAAVRAAWAILALLRLPALRRVLEGAGLLVMRFDRRHRSIVADNLRIAFPDWSQAELDRGVREAFRYWGRIAAELVRCDEAIASADTTWVAEAERRRRELAEAGRGVLVLTAHTGNFELLGRIWGRRGGREITVFHRPLSNRAVDGFLVAQRAAMNVRTLGRGAEVRRALRVLADGGVVAVPLDQNQPPSRPGVFVEMFGRPAATATSLARLSMMSGAPVLPVFAAWEGDRATATVGRPIRAGAPEASGAGRDAELTELTARYTREIEAVVRRFPGQWNWAHRRWKTQPNKQ